MIIPMQQRRDTAANWTAKNSVLHDGEIGIEKDTGKAKVGDGTTAWNSLPYWNPDGVTVPVSSVFGRTGAVTAQSGDYASFYDTAGAATTAQSNAEAYADTNKLAKSANLSDLTSAATARTNLGLGSAATQPSSAFDAAGAATSAVAAARPSWITLPSNWYSGPWFTAKAAGFTSPAWILFDGDSVTNGVNPANTGYLATGWPDQLRAKVLANTGAQVYGDFYAIWSYSAGAGAVDPVNEGFATPLVGATTYEGGFGTCLSPGTANAWYQIISTGSIPGWTSTNVTGFDLVYYDFGACTWGFTIDGGQGGTPTVSGATWTGSMWQVTNTGGSFTAGNVKKVTVSGLSAATHQIEYGQISSAGNMMPIGISLYTGNTGGVGFVRSAYSGRRSVDSATAAGSGMSYSGTLSAFPADRPALWSGYGPANSTAQITPTPFGFPTQPTLAFVAYGINDCATWVNPEAMRDAIYRKIIAIRRGVANANIGIIAFSYPDSHNSDNNLAGNGARYSRYKRVMSDLANDYNCAYIDIDAKWGGTPVTQGFQQSGNVHPTLAGSQDIANVIANIM